MGYKLNEWSVLTEDVLNIYIGEIRPELGDGNGFEIKISKGNDPHKKYIESKEIYSLIADGLKFRSLQKAEKIKMECVKNDCN